MKFLSKVFKAAVILNFLGLERKSTASKRAVAYTACIAGGAIVGAGVALMVAPKSGRELRADLQQRARTLQSRVSESRVFGKAKEKLSEAKSQLQNARDEVVAAQHV